MIVTRKKTYIDPRHLPDIDAATVRRLLSYLHPYRSRVWLVFGVVVFGALLNLLPPLFIKGVIDHLERVSEHAAPGSPRLVFLLCAGMVAAPLAADALGAVKKYLTTFIGEHVMLDLRVQLFDQLHRQPLRRFVHAKPGEMLSSVLNDVQGTGSALSSTLVGVLDNGVDLLATAGLILYLDWRLGLVALLILPLFAFPTRRAGRRRKRLRRAAQLRMAELTGLIVETLSVSGAQVIRLFGTEALERERLRLKGREVIDLSLEQTLAGRWFQMIIGLMESAGPAIVFAVGGYLILQGRAHALGTLVAFVAAFKRLSGPATSLAGAHVDIVTSYAYFERVFHVLDLEPAIRTSADAISPATFEGTIVFDRVSLVFPDGETGVADVSARIEAGQTVAIVGASGAGKSTLAGLVPRLDDPTAGRVMLDGLDLRRLDVRWLRSHIAVVTQETFLFHATVLDNLRYGRPEASRGEVEVAARAACIHDVIAALPEGYDTIVGERGHRLSGGERQRIAIARALLRDPKILILDEATSSLDSENETLIQVAVERLRRGRTSLVIAHRLSTVRHADSILVLDRGRLVERGTHDQLMAAGGVYTRLCGQQFAPAALGLRRRADDVGNDPGRRDRSFERVLQNA